MKIKKLVFGIIAATALFAGFGNTKAQANDNAVLGILIGGATGGFIGSNVGKGKGQLAATAAGALLGAAIGNEWSKNTYRTKTYKTVYNPNPRYEPVAYPTYEPAYDPYYEPAYVPTPKKRADKVIVHKHKVTVKHVYVKPNKSRKQWSHNKNRRKFEKRRRELAQACYDRPRRCAKAF